MRVLKSLLKRMGYFVIIFIIIVAIYIMTYVASTTTFLATSNYDSSLGREVGYLDDMDYDLRVPGEILTVEVYNDYEIACLTSFGAIFVNGNEGSIHYLIEVDDRASLLKEIASYKDKAKERQVVVTVTLVHSDAPVAFTARTLNVQVVFGRKSSNRS